MDAPPEDEVARDGAASDTDSDWAWRRKIRANPRTRLIYRLFVGLLGACITVLGLVLIPAPGPGWLVVFAGLAILASEFEPAERLLQFARHRVGQWTSWAARQPLPARLALGLGAFAVLVGMLWISLRLTGVPGFVPDALVPSWTHLTT